MVADRDEALKKQVWIAVAVLVVAAIGTASVWRSTSGAQAPGGTGQASTPAGLAATPSVEAAPTASTRPPHPVPDLARTRESLEIAQDPFSSGHPEERRWLDQHGFPNGAQWTRYQQASDAELDQAARAGDTVAATMLDGRRLGADPTAESRLLAAGADGDLFALSLLSSWKAGAHAAGIPEAYAISRVAEMRGDLTAALHREMMLGARLSGDQRLLAEAEALHLNLHLNALYRQKHGVDPPPVEMRPYQVDPDDTQR